jgi:hypothetical protein
MTRLGTLIPLLALLAGGCDIRFFALQPDSGPTIPDGGGGDVLPPDDGATGNEGGEPDGGGDGTVCVPSNGGLEICDGLDNDCNGVTDDVDPGRLAVDPNNCGQCGHVCADPARHVIGQCVGGECTQWACSAGTYKDVNGDLTQYPAGDGCECTVTNGGQEICDGIDNDCNGVVDDGFDKTQSPNCGECDNACAFRNALALCSVCDCTDADCKGCGGGAAQGHKCALGACLPNPDPGVNASFINLNGDRTDGCEYYCLLPTGQTGTQPEVCDGYDNDCDGCPDGIRTGFDAQGLPICAPHPALTTGYCQLVAGTCNLTTGVCTGECKAGVNTCQQGVTGCFGYVGPSYEVCNGKDDDCDGATDNGYDRLTDARYCLGAGIDPVSGLCNPCQLAHAIPKCEAGACKILSCLPGWVNADTNDANGCEYPCTVTNGGVEICDGIDNNCNGQTDEGFNLQTDVHHCGTCANDCTNLVQHPESAHAEMRCNAGACEFVRCLNNGTTGYWNADGNAANGCEYFCSKTNGGTEICDGKDNNCNGQIDEGFNKQTDPSNCGSCGNVCAYFHAAGVCNAGHCQMGACDAGWVNLDGLTTTGCEYQCTVTNGGTEICDGLDNDCNGTVDDAWAAQKGAACVAGQGRCAQFTAGVYVCNPGDRTKVCCGDAGNGTCINPLTGAQAETCNGIDDDCNGAIDDNVATNQTDPNNCGACGNRCDVAYSSLHATWSCVAGACHATGCLNNGTTGYWDANGDLALAPGAGNGCEYSCTKTSPSTEVCDGKDNDCNGKTDLDDPGIQWPTAGNFCVQVGECGKGDHTMSGGSPPDNAGSHAHWPGTASHPVCRAISGVTAWYCNYPATVDLTAPNTISFWELRCDGLDNNCDGTADRDRWAALGNVCAEDGTYGTTLKNGVCRGTGHLVCKDGLVHPAIEPPANGLSCNVETPGLAPSAEICDGKDNNCDGLTDNGATDNWVRVQRADSTYFWIYQYEASRPDATNLAQGLMSHRSCSNPTVLPWTNIKYPDAVTACTNAGGRLCTEAEWQRACDSTSTAAPNWRWSFDTTPQTWNKDYCNGNDRLLPTPDGGVPPNDLLLPTASLSHCDVTWNATSVYDLSGNAKEWTAARSAGVNPLRGGSYDDTQIGISCQWDWVLADDTFRFQNVGFRCCRSTAP